MTLSLRADVGDRDVDQECSPSSERGELHAFAEAQAADVSDKTNTST
jgi:hypothetical protein